MKRPLIFLVVATLLAGACSSDESSDEVSTGEEAEEAAAGPFSPPPPAGSETIPTEPGSYNYSPAVMAEGDVIKAWWCSAVPEAATDNIWYQEYNKKTKKASNRQSVLQVGKPGDWDTFGVCHPSVIRGSWPGAPGGGEFTYAMYYTSTNVSQGGGSSNSTGVVFSTDGINWSGQHDRYNPMIRQKVKNAPGSYGAGLPAALSRGGSAVTLFWTDTTSERRGARDFASRTVFAHSEDGIKFGPTTLVSQAGAPAYWKNDFAIDDSVQPAVMYSAQALTFRQGDGKEEKNETLNFGFYRAPADEVLAGRGQWEELGVVDTNLTGFTLNFEPGLVRTGEGKVLGSVEKDGLEVWFGGGGQTPHTWGLRSVTLTLGDKRLPLRRHTASPANSTSYWVTTGFVPQLFRSGKADTLGFLAMKPGTGTVPLYACQRGPLATDAEGQLTGVGADRYVTLERCPDNELLGINGYVFSEAPAGVETKPLYACLDGQAQFVSNDPKCEGKTVERLLGHAHSG